MDPAIGMLAVSGLLGGCIGWGLAQWRAAPKPAEQRDLPDSASGDGIATESREREMELVQVRAESAKAQSRLEEAQAELRKMRDLLDAQTTTDRLTGLANFRAARDRLQQEFWRSQRHHTGLSVMRVDIDRLGEYNSANGGRAGNRYIKHVATVLQHCARNTDMVASHGGGEFVVLLTETNAQGAMIAARRVLQQIAAIPLGTWQPSVSIGVSSMRVSVDDPLTLMDEAQRALLSAKNTGRNCVVHNADIRDGQRPSQSSLPAAGV